jgi:NusA-like KH domain protein
MVTKTFDMQFIRYINLFSRVTQVSAKHCFAYNNMLVFVVPRFALERAIGKDNMNLKKLSDILGKRIRVVAEPTENKDIERFIAVIVSPIQFDKVEIVKNDNQEAEAVITTPGRESKAMLIGRGRARETELKDILEQYFKVKSLRIN